MGLIRVTYLALDYMGKHAGGKGGVVVNIASMAGMTKYTYIFNGDWKKICARWLGHSDFTSGLLVLQTSVKYQRISLSKKLSSLKNQSCATVPLRYMGATNTVIELFELRQYYFTTVCVIVLHRH